MGQFLECEPAWAESPLGTTRLERTEASTTRAIGNFKVGRSTLRQRTRDCGCIPLFRTR